MNLRDHVFVREHPPLEASAFCPICTEPWAWCACDLPEYPGAWAAELFQEKTDEPTRKAA